MPEQTSLPLSGKTVVQFGGTGLLGPVLLKGISDAGATVVAASRDRDSVKVSKGAAGSVIAEQVDAQDEASIRALRDRVVGRFGRIDGVVFNSTSHQMRAVGDDLALWKESMAINATGFFASVRAFAESMEERGSGSIVNIASIHGMIGANPWLYPGTGITAAPDYFFHKGGMLSLTRYLASCYGARGVRVNAVSPGGIFNPAKPQPPAFLERYAACTMLGRMADAREIVGAVVFLLSDASSYVTGANIPVDGGYTAK